MNTASGVQRLLLWSLMVAPAAGCAGGGESAAAGSTTLPTLVPLGSFDGPNAWRGNGGVAVDDQGRVAFVLQGEGDDPRFAVMDPSGRIVSTFARTGDGPGEVRGVGSIWFDGDLLIAFGLSTMRIDRFRVDGTPVDQVRLAPTMVPMASIGDEFVGFDFGGEALALVRVQEGDDPAPLVPADEAYDTLVRLPAARAAEGRSSAPAIAIRERLLAYADPWSYRIAWVRGGRTVARAGEGVVPSLPTEAEVAALRASASMWRGPNGRPMDPRAQDEAVERFASRPSPHFDRRTGMGMAFDGAGRLWIPRTVGDSVAWDLFAPGRLLGTLTLPCGGGRNRGRSVSGTYVVMECEEANDSLPRVRLWRIEG